MVRTGYIKKIDQGKSESKDFKDGMMGMRSGAWKQGSLVNWEAQIRPEGGLMMRS